jgi:hypothetical protein
VDRKQEFEDLLTNITNARMHFAGRASGARPKGKPPRRLKADLREFDWDVDDEAVISELRRAKSRQKRDPALFCGDPDGFFTYDDPVLAITAYLFHAHLRMSDALAIAGSRAEGLRNDALWTWAKVAVQTWLKRDHKSYGTLMGMTPRRPLVFDKDILRIAVTGDAGYEGPAQAGVLSNIRDRHKVASFDLLIHLGDVYFAGHPSEFLKNFLAPFMRVGPRVLTLVGNHDLYFGAEAFLSAMDILKQEGRYFSVENEYWKVICLDTALYAERLRRNSGLLDQGQLNWLDEQLETRNGKKVILMSHHYAISGWGKPSLGLKRQLTGRLNQVFAWYWGHEHCCATYSKGTSGINGACVGNGSFLEVKKEPTCTPAPTWYAKGHCICVRDDSKFWPHGYLELELLPGKLVETFHLEGGKSYRRTLRR